MSRIACVTIGLAFPLLLSAVLLRPVTAAEARPNLVLILADDVGYGDLGCYGSRRNATPHIDRLAAEGLRFTDFHSNGPMCSATRAALLTGCYQQRFGPKFDGALSHARDPDNGLPRRAVTLAEVLRQAGYATGLFGKWHLGYHPSIWPTQQGFDEFIGLGSGDGDHHTQIDREGHPDWWHGDRLQAEDGYTTDLITRHSVDFIGRHRDEPFFLYVSHLAIHFPWQGPQDPPHRRAGQDYTHDKWGLLPDPQNIAPHVTQMVKALDDSVGQIVAAVRAAGIADRTLILFASDNGGYLRYGTTHANISSNGPLRGQKTELYEGGHRVPAIAYWPGKISAGRTTSRTVVTMDLCPTLIDLAGAEPPASQQLDGTNLVELLQGGEQPELAERSLFWRMDDQWAARQGPWKLIGTAAQPPALYHLEHDVGESRDVAAQHPSIVRRLRRAWAAWEQDVNGGFTRP